MHHLLFISICVVWSTSFLLMKRAEPVVGTVGVGFVRAATGAAVLFLAWWWLRRRWPFGWRNALPLVVVAALGNALPYSLQPLLVSKYGSGFIGMMVSFVPLATILVSLPILGRRPRALEIAGVAIGLAAMAILFADGLTRDVPWWAFLVALVVPSSYALSNTLVRCWFPGVPALELTAVALGLAVPGLLPALVIAPPPLEGNLGVALLALLVLGPLGTGFCLAGLYHLIQKRGPLYGGMVTYVIPCGAVLLGWIDDEPVTWRQVVALVGTLVGVVLVHRASPPAPPLAVAPQDLRRASQEP